MLRYRTSTAEEGERPLLQVDDLHGPRKREIVRVARRIQILKRARGTAQDALDRIAVQSRARAAITPIRLEAFSQLMREKLDTGDVHALSGGQKTSQN